MNDMETIPAPSSPFTLLERAMDKGVDADTLAKLTELYERWQTNRAAEEFGRALAKFQAECPPVVKRREVMNKGGGVRYTFAGFEDVMLVARPHLIAAGIAVSFSAPKVDAGLFAMICRVQVGSHAEDRPFTAPMPNLAEVAKAMYLTEPQAFGLVLSYYKRYSFCAALNVVVTGEDNDAALDPTVGENEVKQINEKIEECEKTGNPVDMDRFLKWLAVESLDQLTMAGFSKAVWHLDRKRRGEKSQKNR